MIETISNAAILHDGKIYQLPRPAQHHNIIRMMAKRPNHHSSHTMNSGFMTSSGRFVDRIEGAAIAIASRQIKELKHPPNLYSDDIWDGDSNFIE